MNNEKKKGCYYRAGCDQPLGNDRAAFWDNLIKGKSGIDHIEHFDVSDYPTKIAAQVRDFNPIDYMGRKMPAGWTGLPSMPVLLQDRLLKMLN